LRTRTQHSGVVGQFDLKMTLAVGERYFHHRQSTTAPGGIQAPGWWERGHWRPGASYGSVASSVHIARVMAAAYRSRLRT
jgi:hypothetical protein